MHECTNAQTHECTRARSRHFRLCALLPVCICAFLVSGCFRAQARTTPDMPPLDVPLPPPRLVEAAETEPPEPVTLMPEPARTAPVRPRGTPSTQPGEASKPELPKADAAAEAKPGEELKIPAGTSLRTTPTAQEGEVERRIRGLLLEATGNLNRIDYGRLNADAKGQYDSAKGFVRQAEDALRSKNLVFASYLADKAATLAAQLRGR